MKKTLLEKIKPAIIYWLARRLPDCKTITPTIGESLDRKLSLREKIVMRLHLWTCDKCANYLEQIKFLSKAMDKHEEKLTEKENHSAVLNSDAKDASEKRAQIGDEFGFLIKTKNQISRKTNEFKFVFFYSLALPRRRRAVSRLPPK